MYTSYFLILVLVCYILSKFCTIWLVDKSFSNGTVASDQSGSSAMILLIALGSVEVGCGTWDAFKIFDLRSVTTMMNNFNVTVIFKA